MGKSEPEEILLDIRTRMTDCYYRAPFELS
jgi:hypothetical protein